MSYNKYQNQRFYDNIKDVDNPSYHNKNFFYEIKSTLKKPPYNKDVDLYKLYGIKGRPESQLMGEREFALMIYYDHGETLWNQFRKRTTTFDDYLALLPKRKEIASTMMQKVGDGGLGLDICGLSFIDQLSILSDDICYIRSIQQYCVTVKTSTTTINREKFDAPDYVLNKTYYRVIDVNALRDIYCTKTFNVIEKDKPLKFIDRFLTENQSESLN